MSCWSVSPSLYAVKSKSRGFVVGISTVVVASNLPGEAVNVVEFGVVSVYNDDAFTLSWKELNLSYHATKLGRWRWLPSVRKEEGSCFLACERSKQAGGRGHSQTWLCNSSAVLPSITNQPFNSPASIHFAAFLLLVQRQLGDAE